MGLKFGQKYQISVFLAYAAFLVATKVSCRDKAFLSRHTAACRDIGRDILLLVATSVATYCLSRHTSNVATYFPDSSLFFFSNLSEP